MRVIAWPTAAVPHLFGLFGRCALLRAEWIEPLENQPAVVTKQFVQPKHPNKEDRIVIIALDPLALAPWTLHRTILALMKLQQFAEDLRRAGRKAREK